MNNKGNGVTFIGPDTSLDGDMTVQGPALVAGKVKGVIRSTDQVKIEVGGEIDGELFCQELRVCGEFKGKLHCNSLVIVSSGVVEGDVSSHKMEIYDGGQFLGARTKGPEEGVLPQATVEDKPEAQVTEAYAFPKTEAPVAEAPIAQAANKGHFNNLKPEPVVKTTVAVQVKTDVNKAEPKKVDVKAEPAPAPATTQIKPQTLAEINSQTSGSSAATANSRVEPQVNTDAHNNPKPVAEPKPKSKLEIKPQPNPQAQLAAAEAARKAQEKSSGSGAKLFVAAIAVAAIAGAVYKKDELTQLIESKPVTASVVKPATTVIDIEPQQIQPAENQIELAKADEVLEPSVSVALTTDIDESEIVTTANDAPDSAIEMQATASAETEAELEVTETALADETEDLLVSVNEAVVAVEDEVVSQPQVDSLMADLLAEETTDEVASSAEATDTVGSL
ncbi:polymer-forming cytoskeletal protein [Shewanella sp. 6_MG-2023]|uniref:polymer-forming cytoskeletal protein n=1 Tax=Shewanella sp. 6_MG-2023 TaxID=3062660 RepID=UPI0026E437A9|nr:polymer-forming cytoskeletal protein [Shewanella sp. 6_MG-2023]MDO6619730.1 polymer-forming cytoskeletal protein [Shewanella sp. 6_MG-2023]